GDRPEAERIIDRERNAGSCGRETDDHQNGSPESGQQSNRPIRPFDGRQRVSTQPDEVAAHQGNKNDVRIQFALERKPQQRDQRPGEKEEQPDQRVSESSIRSQSKQEGGSKGR